MEPFPAASLRLKVLVCILHFDLRPLECSFTLEDSEPAAIAVARRQSVELFLRVSKTATAATEKAPNFASLLR